MRVRVSYSNQGTSCQETIQIDSFPSPDLNWLWHFPGPDTVSDLERIYTLFLVMVIDVQKTPLYLGYKLSMVRYYTLASAVKHLVQILFRQLPKSKPLDTK